MVECRSFEIKLISACDLPDVRHLGEMKVYAKVSVIRDLSSFVWTTAVDKGGKTNPIWNCRIKTSIPEKVLQQGGGGKVVIVLYCNRTLNKDKYVGEVHLSLKKLFDHGLACENLECNVRRNNAEGTFGTLKFSYNFGECTMKIDTMNIDVQTGSSSTTGQGPRRGISPSEVASAFADGLQIGEALSQGPNLYG